MSTTAFDALGVAIRKDDTVMVTAWGRPVRLNDTGRKVRVTGFTARGNVLLDDTDHRYDPVARGRSVGGSYLTVLRRDGQQGFEGNRPAAEGDLDDTKAYAAFLQTDGSQRQVGIVSGATAKEMLANSTSPQALSFKSA